MSQDFRGTVLNEGSIRTFSNGYVEVKTRRGKKYFKMFETKKGWFFTKYTGTRNRD